MWIKYAPICCRSACGCADGTAVGFSSIHNLQKAAFTLSSPVRELRRQSVTRGRGMRCPRARTRRALALWGRTDALRAVPRRAVCPGWRRWGRASAGGAGRGRALPARGTGTERQRPPAAAARICGRSSRPGPAGPRRSGHAGASAESHEPLFCTKSLQIAPAPCAAEGSFRLSSHSH